MENIALIVWIAFWIYCVYYCRKVARLTGARTDVALLVSFLFPIPALLLYAYYSYKARKQVGTMLSTTNQ